MWIVAVGAVAAPQDARVSSIPTVLEVHANHGAVLPRAWMGSGTEARATSIVEAGALDARSARHAQVHAIA